MKNALFAKAIRSAIDEWRQGLTFDQAAEALQEPKALAERLLPLVEAQCAVHEVDLTELRDSAWNVPYIHFTALFEVLPIEDTPQDFLPVTDSESTVMARVAAIASMAATGLDAVSYGSENDGALFVNLVVIPGEGKVAEKSKDAMRGHTDAVSFPVRGHADPQIGEIAPSPDFVCLVGLRNPNAVKTTVMPVTGILAQLSQESIDELMKPNFEIRAQTTFLQGTKRILGKVHIADGVACLYRVGAQMWLRFSHRNVMADSSPEGAAALESLKEACLTCAEEVVVNPGDVFMVNNRLALHGRTEVGEATGDQSRWLLRGYGLVFGGARADQYHLESDHMLFP